jgi:hypothetical protein
MHRRLSSIAGGSIVDSPPSLYLLPGSHVANLSLVGGAGWNAGAAGNEGWDCPGNLSSLVPLGHAAHCTLILGP